MSLSDALPFLLIVATVVGALVAALLGKLLDRSSARNARVLGIVCSEQAEVIDLSHKGILLAPKGAKEPLARLVEKEFTVGNIGFDTLSNITIKLHVDDDESGLFSKAVNKTHPPDLEFISEKVVQGDEAYGKITYKFLNRGDHHTVRVLAERDFKINITAHNPNVEVRYVEHFEPLPTLRERIGRFIGRGRVIEVVAVTAVAASVAGAAEMIQQLLMLGSG